MSFAHFDFSQEFARAFDLLENSHAHIFITGQAGTGKSTLLQYFRGHTSKKVVVLAPTGVAAVNIKGQTIHSFFKFRPDITPEGARKIRMRKDDRELYRHLEAILIDEISMVRADLLDCIDAFLRSYGPDRDSPFGGVQMMFLGDLYQLPPVVTPGEQDIFRDVYSSPYFFSAKVMETISLEHIDLSRIYRQHEDDFIEILSAIRDKSVTEAQLKLLNDRYQPDFYPAEDDFYVYLTTTNYMADRINLARMGRLRGEVYRFQGIIEGKFDQRSLPTHEWLELKVGSQVMLLNNDSQGRWVNGHIGRVLVVHEDLAKQDMIEVELEDGPVVEVTPFRWEMYRFSYDSVSQSLESETLGSFTQYPLKLAWALTIHKSQGKTFSKVIVDMGDGAFAHGQTYVALSRCTHLRGLVLRKPIVSRHILLDARVEEFMSRFKRSDENSLSHKRNGVI